MEDELAAAGDGTAKGTAEDVAPTTGADSGSSAALGDVSIHLDLTPANPSTPADLDPQQRAVVEHRGAPLLVLAGPGTGKTTTLIEAMVARLQGPDRLRPEQVLGLTFGRQAAADWRDRLISRLGGGLVPAVSTFHAYAFSLVRQHADQLGLMASPRLLAGHEEDIAVRDQLRSLIHNDAADWPDHLRAAGVTHEFARQVRAAVSRARSFNLDAEQARAMAQSARKPEWSLVADVLAQYEFWLESADVFDYAGLISTADALARTPQVASQIHDQIRAVFVDEFQDTDAAQVELLKAIVGPGCELVVVGDPDQSIYAFRGAQVRGILDFAEHFGTVEQPAIAMALQTCRRFGPRIRAAADIEINKVDYAGSAVWAAARTAHRDPLCIGSATNTNTNTNARDITVADTITATDSVHAPIVSSATAQDSVSIFLAADARSEAAEIAERIRALRHAGARWDDIVVLTRTVDQIEPLRRAFVAADIPVAAAGDETPIRRDQAVAPLLDALLLIERPTSISAAVARELLVSPLCGVDPADLRRIVRDVRKHAGGDTTPSTPEVLCMLVADPEATSEINPSIAPVGLAALKAFHLCTSRARTLLNNGAGVEEVLWAVWNGNGTSHSWPVRLRRQSLRGGAGGRRADRDIDAVMTLFEMASRAGHTRGRTCQGFVSDVRGQQVPVSEVRSSIIGSAVAVMTAHRAKGLEWDHVFIAGVQEGVWPNVISRTGLVTADEMQHGGLSTVQTAAELLAEERRLFYVCVTRAKRSVVVSAVQGADNSPNDERPSRFLMSMLPATDGFDAAAAAELERAEPGAHSLLPVLRTRGASASSLTALVAQLRRVLGDSETSAEIKHEAARRLAMLAQRVPVRHNGPHPALPESWWGAREVTVGPRPVRPPEPLRLSPTAVESVATCSLRWFFERQMSAQTLTGTAAAFGSVVHAVCEHIALSPTQLTAADVEQEIDRIWGQMGYQATWIGTRERDVMSQAVERFLVWHQEQIDAGVTVAGVEVDIRAEVTVLDDTGTPHAVVIAGRADRIDTTSSPSSGTHAVVYDIKSYKRAPSKKDVATNIQLALYALAVEKGGTDKVPDAASVDAGLVLVKVPAKVRSPLPKVMTQSGVDQGDFDVEPVLASAAATLRAEVFEALPGKHCDFCQMKVCCPAKMPSDKVQSDEDTETADDDD